MTIELSPAEQAEWNRIIDAEIASAPALSSEQINRLSALFDHTGGGAAT